MDKVMRAYKHVDTADGLGILTWDGHFVTDHQPSGQTDGSLCLLQSYLSTVFQN